MQTQFLRHSFQFRLPSPRRVGFAVELVQVFSFPKSPFAKAEVFFRAINRERVGSICLELDRVGTSLFCRTDEFRGFVKTLAMVGRHFSNDIGRLTRTYLSSTYLHRMHSRRITNCRITVPVTSTVP